MEEVAKYSIALRCIGGGDIDESYVEHERELLVIQREQGSVV
jgi:hypothetical protein